jgi:hypothetical protein
MRTLLLAISIAFLMLSAPNTANARPLPHPWLNPCAGPQGMTIFWCGDAATVAKQHNAIMTAAIENQSDIMAKIGSAPASGLNMLKAMLKVDGVPQTTKTLVEKLLKTPQPLPMTKACQSVINSVKDKIPQNLETPAQLADYLLSQSQDSKSCPTFREGIQAAFEVVQQGASTIYNTSWIATHGKSGHTRKMHINWKTVKKIAIADAIGVLGGCLGGVGGMVVGGAAGSLGAI